MGAGYLFGARMLYIAFFIKVFSPNSTLFLDV